MCGHKSNTVTKNRTGRNPSAGWDLFEGEPVTKWKSSKHRAKAIISWSLKEQSRGSNEGAMANGESRRGGEDGEEKWHRQPIPVPSWAVVSGLSRNMNFFIATITPPQSLILPSFASAPPPHPHNPHTEVKAAPTILPQDATSYDARYRSPFAPARE